MGFENAGGHMPVPEADNMQKHDIRMHGVPLPSGLILDRAEVLASFPVYANGEQPPDTEPDSPPPELPKRRPGRTYRVEPLSPLVPPSEPPEETPPEAPENDE